MMKTMKKALVMTDKIDIGQLRKVEITKQLIEQILNLGDNTLVGVSDNPENHSIFAVLHVPTAESKEVEGTVPTAYLSYRKTDEGEVVVEVKDAEYDTA